MDEPLINPVLTLDDLLREADLFTEAETLHDEPLLYGVTDGKAVGTYLEHKFVGYLQLKYTFAQGDSALGVDLPSLKKGTLPLVSIFLHSKWTSRPRVESSPSRPDRLDLRDKKSTASDTTCSSSSTKSLMITPLRPDD